MATIAEQVAQDVARGLYSAIVGQQILDNAGLSDVQLRSGVPGKAAAFGLNPMQRNTLSFGSNTPVTPIAAPGPMGDLRLPSPSDYDTFLASLPTGPTVVSPWDTGDTGYEYPTTLTPTTVTPTPIVVAPDPMPTANVTQAQEWQQKYGIPGSSTVVSRLSGLSADALQELVDNPDFLALYPGAQAILDAKLAAARTPTTGMVPWDTMPAGSVEQILGKINQDFYTTGIQGTVGPYAALTGLYNDTATYLTSQGKDPTDENVYATMSWLAGKAAEQTGETVADKFFWYDKNIADWIYEGRPSVVGGDATAALFGESSQIMLNLNRGEVIPNTDLAKITDVATRTRAANILAQNIVASQGNTPDAQTRINGIFSEYFDAPGTNFLDWSTSVGMQYDTAGNLVGTPTVTQPIDVGNIADPMFNVDKPFGTAVIPTPTTVTTIDAPPPGFNAAEWAGLTPDQKAKFAADFPELITDTTGTAVTPTAFTGSEFAPSAAAPATADIFAGMQPQEDFKQDVFRRFLAEQVSPQTGQLQPLSPFMMRGAQNLYPQLLGEYSTSVYDPANWTDAGNQQTFGNWLRAGQRPTRESMFGTLGDIGNVIGAGQQGITAPGISLGESLRRQNIMNQFGTETADSRQALQSLFSTAALKGVAPSFRYPVQSAAQGLFETQRALQPEKSFLSFLSERM